MDSHTRGSSESRQYGGQDTDESLENELPEVLLGVIHGNDCGLDFGIIDRLGHTLVDNLFEYLLQKVAKKLLHN